MCVGAYLSRRETTVAMERLLDRTNDLRLDPDHAVRYVGFRNRGPKALQVLFERV
jgi:cytochrome P450